MDLLQIEYFLAVARTENMTAAANSLHVAQSSVSRCIARLEESLGVPLFERSGRGIVLSDYGRAFYPRAEAIMQELSDGERQIREMRDQSIGRVSISTCAARQINQLMIQYTGDHPDVLFRQRRVYDADEVKALLDSGAVDYALTFAPLPAGEYDWTPLIEEQFYLMVPAAHPYARREYLELEDLFGQRILLNDSDRPELLEQRIQSRGGSLTFGFIGNEYEVIGSMVEHDAGVAVISTLGLHDLRRALPMENLARIRIIPIHEPTLHRTLGVVCSKRHYMSQAAKDFYQQLIGFFKLIRQ